MSAVRILSNCLKAFYERSVNNKHLTLATFLVERLKVADIIRVSSDLLWFASN